MQTFDLRINNRIRSTPFTSRVEALGVKSYTVYNHMLLPTVFQTLEDDYRHLCQHVQLWDVSVERQVQLLGPDAARLAQLMTPRDLSRATFGQCLYAPMVDQHGGVLNDPVILKLADDHWWLSIADSDVLLWAKGLALGLALDVEVTEPTVWPLAVQGPKAEQLMSRVFGTEVTEIRFFRFRELPFQGHPLVVARSGWSAQGGFEIYLDRADLGLPLWDALWQAGDDLSVGPGAPNTIERIEAGLLSYGGDFNANNNPFECGLDKYCQLDRSIEFIGRAALEKIRAAGVQRRIRGLLIDSERLPLCYDPWPIMAATSDTVVGAVSSAAQSPRLGRGVAIAMLDKSCWEVGCPVQVETPVGVFSATVADLPLT